MEAGIFNALLEFGAMGLFAAFLVWQHLSMQKRFDKLIDRFQEQLSGIQEKTEQNDDKLRERYDKVIEQYQADKTQFTSQVGSNVDEAIRKAQELQDQIKSLPFETLGIQIESLSLNQRNSYLMIEKILTIIKTMEENQRIKEMAKKLTKDC